MSKVVIDIGTRDWGELRARKWVMLKLARLFEQNYISESVKHIVESLDYVADMIGDMQSAAADILGDDVVYGSDEEEQKEQEE